MELAWSTKWECLFFFSSKPYVLQLPSMLLIWSLCSLLLEQGDSPRKGGCFHGSVILAAAHALLLFTEKYTPGDVNNPSKWLGNCPLIQLKWHESGCSEHGLACWQLRVFEFLLMKNLFPKKHDFWFILSGKLNIKRDYGEKSKGLEVFTTADMLFWAQGRKTLRSWGAVTPLGGSSESRKSEQDQSDICCSEISGISSDGLGW